MLDDPDAVAHAVAAWLVEAVKAMGDRTIAISLSGGQTPRLLYGALAEAPYCQNMPWPRIHLFWSDERFVPSTDERNNF
ncbi:MAG TPA: 6-phosphogluconolactonase, partial [Burkholderiales bacterium]|nr:6-phosphogluconolactonase [Burkholderiales bacterium]